MDHSHNKNFTFPVLSFLTAYHTVPLYTGFSGKPKIQLIFKMTDTDIVPLHKGRKGIMGTFI